MNTKLFLLLALVGVSACVKLEPLCNDSIFIHKGVKINSIHRVEYRRPLDRAMSLCIEEYDEFDEYFDDLELKRQMVSVQKQYNELMVTLYSDYYTALYPSKIDSDIKIMEALLKNVTITKESVVKSVKSFDKFVIQRVQKGMHLAKTLWYNFYYKLYFSSDQEKGKLEDIFYKLETEEGQIAALQNDLLDRIFTYQLIDRPQVEITRYNKNFFDLNNNSTVVANLTLPYYDPKFDNDNVYENCLKSSDLPPFYV